MIESDDIVGATVNNKLLVIKLFKVDIKNTPYKSEFKVARTHQMLHFPERPMVAFCAIFH